MAERASSSTRTNYASTDPRLPGQHRDEHQADPQPRPRQANAPSATRRRPSLPPSAASPPCWPTGLAPPPRTPASGPAEDVAAPRRGGRRLRGPSPSPRNCPPATSTAAETTLLRQPARPANGPALLARDASTGYRPPRRLPPDDDEYRAITRKTIIRGLAGTISLDPPRSPSTSTSPAPPRHPRPGAAHRRDRRHPARHARRQPPHRLPPRAPARRLDPQTHSL